MLQASTSSPEKSVNTNGYEEEDEEEEDRSIKPVTDGRTITFQPKILNEYLTCELCKGYFRNPVTIRECLHTFCKSCIYLYIVENANTNSNLGCPTCKIGLGTRPFESVKEDCVLQELVVKIFPQVFEKDKEDERRFYLSIGKPMEEPLPPLIPPVGQKRKLPEAPQPAPVQKKAKPVDDTKIKLKLAFLQSPEGNDEDFRPLARPVLTLSSSATVLHLKKFLAIDLKLPSMDNVEILYKDEVLGPEHSLEYILKTRGHDPTTKATFHFRKKVDIP